MDQDEKNVILVVDDDPSVLGSTSRLLSAFGYVVFPFGNATDAARKLQENNVRVVLTDIMMPEVTGLQFLEKIRSFNSEIPVIMMTAYAELDITIDAIRKGAFDFLLKPFKPEYLAHSVKKAIDHYRLKELEKNYTSTLENTVKNRTRELSDALTLIQSAFDHDKSYKIITAGDGRTSPAHFDPNVLDAFIRFAPDFDRIFQELCG